MKRVRDYILDSTRIINQTLYLPKGAEIISIENSGSLLTLYVLLDPTEVQDDLRTFKICTTSQNFFEDNVKFLGTFKSDFGPRHLFEIL